MLLPSTLSPPIGAVRVIAPVPEPTMVKRSDSAEGSCIRYSATLIRARSVFALGTSQGRSPQVASVSSTVKASSR
jgi:hypothetical protein